MSSESNGLLPPKWNEQLLKSSRLYLHKLHALSDREATIVGVGHIERILSDALKRRLCKSASIDQWLKDESHEITFMLKTKMSHSVGIINENTLKSLKLYDRIRNVFAHVTECTSFNSEPISKYIKQFIEHNKDYFNKIELLTRVDGPVEELKIKISFMMALDIAVLENIEPIIKPIVPIIQDWL
ncbi:MAG: hypothetical protein LBT47_12660 [Deltaproteobacteria bacterium]|jgi:hypothetical protein|nr:hypothetical protein [Deltaproteobacteria bacterium]